MAPVSGWVPGGSNILYLNPKTVEAKKLDVAEVEDVAATAARAESHIARVYTAHELRTGAVPPDDIGRAFCLGYFASRSRQPVHPPGAVLPV